MKNPSFGALHSPLPSQSEMQGRKSEEEIQQPADDFLGDEWLGFTFLVVMEVRFSFKSLRITLNGQHLVVQGKDHLEWPILSKLFGFHGCFLLDPWMSISYHLRAIGRWFKEDEMKGKRFFGFVDLALGWLANMMSIFEEVAGLKMVNEDKFPLLSAWMQEFANSPCQDKMTAKFQALRHAKLAAASPYLKKKFGVHEYVMIHISMCLSANLA
ncbi:hypothetical protein AAG906_018652 [Vitis piasezkii]